MDNYRVPSRENINAIYTIDLNINGDTNGLIEKIILDSPSTSSDGDNKSISLNLDNIKSRYKTKRIKKSNVLNKRSILLKKPWDKIKKVGRLLNDSEAQYQHMKNLIQTLGKDHPYAAIFGQLFTLVSSHRKLLHSITNIAQKNGNIINL